MTNLTVNQMYLTTKTVLVYVVLLLMVTALHTQAVHGNRYSHSVDPPAAEQSNTDPIPNESQKVTVTPLDLHRKLFRQKRMSHLEGVKTIMALGKYDKQYEMIKLVLEKIYTVVTEAQVILREKGFAPGDPFPTDEGLRDVVSRLAENTAFFGDILLRLPDITHDLLKRHHDWDMAVKWGIGFCSESELFEGQDLKMLNLMSQEIGLIEKDPAYVNPYKIEEKTEDLQKELEALLKDKMGEAKKAEKKKKKREKKKGPKLSSIPHTEL